MGTKMKGLLKGLRYITQKFDEDKESEMKIGYPTDVKHVAHIGWDGTSVDSPSWMKEFRSPHGFQSAPLSVNGEPKENPEIKWVSQDSSRRILRTQKSPLNDMEEELPKTTRRHSSAEGDRSITTEIPTRDSSTKSRQSRRSSNSSKPNRQPKDSSLVPDPSSQGLPDIPKKARRKKSKESVNGGSSRSSSRSKANASTPYTSPFLDPGPSNESISRPIINDELCQSSNLKPFENEGDKECHGAS